MNKVKSKVNPRKFEELTIPLIPNLQAYAVSMTADIEDAKDLVQETLFRAFRYFHLFEEGTNLKAWLIKILRNTFINNYRKKKRTPQSVDYDDIQNFYENIRPDEVDSSHTQNDAFSEAFDDELTKSINSLPEDFRTIIILSDLEDFTYEEISEFVNIPVGTVRSRLHRARKTLYAKLYKYAMDKGYLRENLSKLKLAV